MTEPEILAKLDDLTRKAAAHPKDIYYAQALAHAYADLGRWPEALRAFQMAIKLDPENGEHLNNLAAVYEELDDPFQAEWAYREAIRLDPTWATPHYNLGLLCDEQDKVEKAIQAFETFLVLAGDDNERPAVAGWLARLYPKCDLPAFVMHRVRSKSEQKWFLRLGRDRALFLSPEGDLEVVPRDTAARLIDSTGSQEASVSDGSVVIELKRGFNSWAFRLDPSAITALRSWLPPEEVDAAGRPVEWVCANCGHKNIVHDSNSRYRCASCDKVRWVPLAERNLGEDLVEFFALLAATWLIPALIVTGLGLVILLLFTG